ncbi:DUF3954 domain-containing protein [Bacillus toyonensis]|uniref:DUF3954 domain-containing protein n=1 Tax=Bacillus toyonensis TaxID=155322 RepID=A0A2C4PUU5_9BACI|nr:DUF3954 domain-containing protein [Bacillus toyonensis]PGA87912.1 hypothetical protein COL93_29300 [Bacillus toyonensis]PHD55918.1 hypothetical protein COF40_29885 [Bacillus toyonensis]
MNVVIEITYYVSVLKINGIYVVKNGQVQLIEPPQGGFGEQSFVYQNGKVIRMEERKIQLI